MNGIYHFNFIKDENRDNTNSQKTDKAYQHYPSPDTRKVDRTFSSESKWTAIVNFFKNCFFYFYSDRSAEQYTENLYEIEEEVRLPSIYKKQVILNPIIPNNLNHLSPKTILNIYAGEIIDEFCAPHDAFRFIPREKTANTHRPIKIPSKPNQSEIQQRVPKNQEVIWKFKEKKPMKGLGTPPIQAKNKGTLERSFIEREKRQPIKELFPKKPEPPSSVRPVASKKNVSLSSSGALRYKKSAQKIKKNF